MSKHLSPEALVRHARDFYETRQRMANQAEREGIKIIVLNKSERHIAVDPHYPIGYEVSTDGCTCKTWALFDKCYHHALLCSELGYGASPDEFPWPDQRPVTFTNAPPARTLSLVAD